MALLQRFETRNDVKLFEQTQNQTKCKNLRGIKKILKQNIMEPLKARQLSSVQFIFATFVKLDYKQNIYIKLQKISNNIQIREKHKARMPI